MLATAQAVRRFLTNFGNPFIITSLENAQQFFDVTCGDGRAFANTKPSGRNEISGSCPAQGYITICPLALSTLSGRVLIDERTDKNLADSCSQKNRNTLNEEREEGEIGGFNWEVLSGARGMFRTFVILVASFVRIHNRTLLFV
jgi:hypothetical protein